MGQDYGGWGGSVILRVRHNLSIIPPAELNTLVSRVTHENIIRVSGKPE